MYWALVGGAGGCIGPVTGSCCGSSGEEQGRGETDQNRALTFPLVLNIASVCLAWPIKNTENSAKTGRGGGGAIRVCVCVSVWACMSWQLNQRQSKQMRDC